MPSVRQAVETCLEAGAPGITVHPRADERHIRTADVVEIARLLGRVSTREAHRPSSTSRAIRGRRSWTSCFASRPDQCTLVPVVPGEVTSQAGWPPGESSAALRPAVGRLRDAGVRVSIFIDPELEAVRWAADLGADRVELYTEPFARAFTSSAREADESFARYAAAAVEAHDRGLGVNAGHDLDLENLQLFRTLPHLDEVSIGHALVSRALWVGLDRCRP